MEIIQEQERVELGDLVVTKHPLQMNARPFDGCPAFPYLRNLSHCCLLVGVGIGVAIAIGIRKHDWPTDVVIDPNSRSMPILISIPIPTPRVASVRLGVQDRPKPRLLGVVDHWCMWRWLLITSFALG